MCVLIAFVMLRGPESFHNLSQADVQYANLNSASWANGDTTITYTYDNNGSVETKTTVTSSVVKEVVTYHYNLAGRLDKVTTDDQAGTEHVVEYIYNDEGIRVQAYSYDQPTGGGAKSNEKTVTYLVDSYNHTGYAQVLEEWAVEGSTATLTCYTLGDDVIAQKKTYWQWVVSQWELQSTGYTQYLLYDGHGSTRQLAEYDGSVTVEHSYSYDGYGVLLQDKDNFPPNGAHVPCKVAQQATSLLYAGEHFDTDSQNYYLRARWYDSLSGRFNRMDPFAGNNQDPQSLHKYLYCHANPVNNVDPIGKFYSATDVSVTMGIRISIQTLIIIVGAIVAWKRFGPKGHKPDANQQRKINAAKLIIQNNLLDKKFVLVSGQEVVIDSKYVSFDKYYVESLPFPFAAEHRTWPFGRIVLDENIWFALSAELGACTMVHELYHYFHWGFGTMEEPEANELEAQVYIELGLPRSGPYWGDIVEASQEYGFPLP